jgi:hypothetical protein
LESEELNSALRAENAELKIITEQVKAKSSTLMVQVRKTQEENRSKIEHLERSHNRKMIELRESYPSRTDFGIWRKDHEAHKKCNPANVERE